MPKNKSQGESFTGQILQPVILGVFVDLIIDNITELDLSYHVLVAIILGIIYAGIYLAKKRPKQLNITSKTVNIMVILLVFAIIMIFAAALILYFSLNTFILQVGWLVLMIIFIRAARSLPAALVVPKSFLSGVAAVSLGVALSIGGVPVIGYAATGGSVQLTIQNNCEKTLSNEEWDVYIPAFDQQTIDVPPITAVIRNDGSQIFVETFLGTQATFDFSEDVEIRFNDLLIVPGELFRVDLSARQEHELNIECL